MIRDLHDPDRLRQSMRVGTSASNVTGYETIKTYIFHFSLLYRCSKDPHFNDRSIEFICLLPRGFYASRTVSPLPDIAPCSLSPTPLLRVRHHEPEA